MQYTGKLFGKIGRKYIALMMTSEDVDRIESENKRLREFVAEVKSFHDVCACPCGEKMSDTDLSLYLARLKSDLANIHAEVFRPSSGE